MITIAFKPKQVTRTLLSVLPERSRDMVANRFGLESDPRKKTLESIGKSYSITRERVRQIENFALGVIKKSSSYKEQEAIFGELKDLIFSLGAILTEEDFLYSISKDKGIQNHVYFLLVLGDDFDRKKEDEHFRHRWSVNEEISRAVEKALHNLHQSLSHNDLITEPDIVHAFSKRVTDIPEELLQEEIFKRWLALSKIVGRNPMGEWGLASSPNIKARGIRDYAYLVIRRHGSPMHFTEVAEAISETFGRKAHVATCHNELIKDKDRFVLVGRGLYCLSEWGYSDGIVRDVIIEILKQKGAMSKEDLIERVLRERYVKPNTIVVNLQDKTYFKRDESGHYALV